LRQKKSWKKSKELNMNDKEVENAINSLGVERLSHEIYKLYFTCQYELYKYEEAREIAKKIRGKDVCEDLNLHLHLLLESKTNTIITFTHIFLEAIIYDFCAVNFSDTYTKNYIDKLNFLSKWVVIPRLVTGNNFPTDSKAFQLLKKLNKYRNELVHLKTEKNTKESFLREVDKSIYGIGPYECYECMAEALLELRKIGEHKSEIFKWVFIKQIINKEYKSDRLEHLKIIRKNMEINIDG